MSVKKSFKKNVKNNRVKVTPPAMQLSPFAKRWTDLLDFSGEMPCLTNLKIYQRDGEIPLEVLQHMPYRTGIPGCGTRSIRRARAIVKARKAQEAKAGL